MDEETVADALFDLAWELDEADEAFLAEPFWARAADLGAVDARFYQGQALWDLGRLDDAAHAFTLAVAEGDEDAPLTLGVLLEGRGDVAGAETAYRWAIEAGDPEGRAYLGRLLWDTGREEAAELLLRDAVADGCPWSASALAWWLALPEHTDEVIGLFRLARAVDDEALWDLGIRLMRAALFEQAEDVLEEAIADGCTDALLTLARVHRAQGDLTRAEACVRRAVALCVFGALADLGELLEDQKRYLEADQAFALGAVGGDSWAVECRRHLRSRYRRQLNRAWRKALRELSRN